MRLGLSSFSAAFFQDYRWFQDVYGGSTRKAIKYSHKWKLILDSNKIRVEYSRDENGANQINANITTANFPEKMQNKPKVLGWFDTTVVYVEKTV